MQLAGLISDDAANLREVMRDKQYHIERYAQFSKEAEQDGDLGVAALFKTLLSDDQQQLRNLEKALAKHEERNST